METIKYKLYIILALLLNISSFSPGYCQVSHSQVKAVKIGEKVPDFLFKTVLQYSKPTLSLSELRGKAIILDIWSTTCGPCIEALPKMAELQKQFGDQIIILPVCVNNELRTVNKFITARKGTKFEMKLPSVVFEPHQEKSFRALFPYFGFPHEIWIDKEGILRATTDERFVNAEILSKFIGGQTIDWQMQTFDANYKTADVLFSDGVGAKSRSFLYKSSISGFQEGVQSPTVFYKDSSAVRITIPNKTLLEIVKTSLQGPTTYLAENMYVHSGPFDSDVFNKQLLIKAKGQERFIRFFNNTDTSYTGWYRRNAKCYELVLPSSYTWEEACNFMKQDLERFFKIEITVQQLPVKYLALIKANNYDGSVESKKEQKEIYKEADDMSTISFQNRPIDLLTSFLMFPGRDCPLIIDETGIKGNINISLERDKNYSLPSYNKKLKVFGLILIERTRDMPVLIISDK